MPATLRMVFNTAGKDLTLSYNYANAATAPNTVKTLADTVVANKDIFPEPPLECVGAEFVVTTKVPVDISE